MSVVAKVFKNGRSQAIRIPKQYKVESEEVYIDKVGDTLIIRPKANNKWDNFFETLKNVDTSGFLEEREQPQVQEKEIF